MSYGRDREIVAKLLRQCEDAFVMGQRLLRVVLLPVNDREFRVETFGDKGGAAMVRDQIGRIFAEQGRYEEALTVSNRGDGK